MPGSGSDPAHQVLGVDQDIPEFKSAGKSLQISTAPEKRLKKLVELIEARSTPCRAFLVHHSLFKARHCGLIKALIETGSEAHIYMADPNTEWRNDDMKKDTHDALQDIKMLCRKYFHPEYRDQQESFMETLLNAKLFFYFYTSPCSIRATMVTYWDDGELKDGFASLGHYVISADSKLIQIGHDKVGVDSVPVVDFCIDSRHHGFKDVYHSVANGVEAMCEYKDVAYSIADGEWRISKQYEQYLEAKKK